MRFPVPPPPEAPHQPRFGPWTVRGRPARGLGILTAKDAHTRPSWASRSPAGGVFGVLSEPNPPRRRHTWAVRGLHTGSRRPQPCPYPLTAWPPSESRASDAGGFDGLGEPRNRQISGTVLARIHAILCNPVHPSALSLFCTTRL